MQNYIKPIQKELEKELHQFSQLFMLIGKGNRDTPRYFNLKEIDPINKTLKIGSTQQGNLYFFVNYDNKINSFIDTDEFWQQFAKFRTNFLLENYPTIDTQ